MNRANFWPLLGYDAVGMSREEELRWAEPSTLLGLGQLGALWLEGELSCQPAYGGGPAEETTPQMIRAMAAANRRGFYTHQSQPGLLEPHGGPNGELLVQCAAVQGFIDDHHLDRFLESFKGTGRLLITLGWPRRWRNDHTDAIKVTWLNHRPVSSFGTVLSKRHIRHWWLGWGLCSRQAQDALCRAAQVTIVDPQPGANSLLWPLLEAAMTQPVR